MTHKNTDRPTDSPVTTQEGYSRFVEDVREFQADWNGEHLPPRLAEDDLRPSPAIPPQRRGSW